jgi:hypothetical protein
MRCPLEAQNTTISNKGRFYLLRVLMIILLLAILADLSLSQLSGSLGEQFEKHPMALAAAAVMLLLILLRFRLFELDDGYEMVHIISRSIFSLNSSRSHKTAFSKRKMSAYSIKSSRLQRRLQIELKDFAGIESTQKHFDIRLLSRSEREELTRSLEAVLEKYKA